MQHSHHSSGGEALVSCSACEQGKAPKAPMTVFASKSLAEHFIRGVLGIAFLYIAYQLALPGQSLAAFGGAIVFVGLSLWALRGCPVCWSVGLINTVAGILHRKQQAREP